MTILLQWRGGALSPATSAVAPQEAEAWPAFGEIDSSRGVGKHVFGLKFPRVGRTCCEVEAFRIAVTFVWAPDRKPVSTLRTHGLDLICTFSGF
ncbi:hypothetical protein O7A70_18735 [Mesorhizobium sp. Cs1299R1N1]|uniref:hypothetical protein n=1 Tax=Mesorhizobium sp. Cs1299R1N1 TaxID=3015172 RepID=UPI00301D4EA5